MHSEADGGPDRSSDGGSGTGTDPHSSSHVPPVDLEVSVAGGHLHALRWGRGPRAVLGIHGITASCMSLLPVARRLPPDWTLVAPDLRGRGASSGLPGPFGMQAHADDCASVIGAAFDGPAVVVGESMGGFVAVVLAATRPDLVERLVLVDGGLPIPVPEGVDADALAEAVLGPALARLRMTFPSADAYLEFWRGHPAVGEDWNDDVEAYLRYDLVPVDGGAGGQLRSRVAEAAVRADSYEVLRDPTVVRDALVRVRCPVELIRAPRNLANEEAPLIPDPVVEEWRGRLPRLGDRMVPGTNHYTLMLGGRGARLIAELVTGAQTPSRGATSEK